MSELVGWEVTTWGTISDLRYGKALRDYRGAGGDVPVFGTNGPVGLTDSPQCSGPGVIIGRKGAYRGVHYSELPFWVIDTAFYLAPKSRIDMRWAYYSLQLADINGLDSGSAIPSTTRESFGAIAVLVPPLPEQQAIAEVLGALDDKIAANTALAATALELADKLFPPESGETSTRLADVVAVTKGNSYRSADLGPSDHALVTLKSITRDGRYAIEGLKQFTGQYRPQQVISPGEIVVAQTDLTQAAEVVGRAVRVPASDDYTLVASLDLAIVRPLRGIDQTYLLGLLRQPQFREHCRSNTTGTTVLHLRSGAIEEFAAQLADSEVQAVYARATLPLQQVADSAAAENRTLAATRDALLPQLMSGKLRVRDAEELIVQAGV